MKVSRSLLVSGSLLALTACGASSNSAPVVYGTQPAQGRIYNSPAEIYLEQPSVDGTIRRTPERAVQPSSQLGSRVAQAPNYQSQAYAAPVETRQGVRIYNAPPSANGSLRQPATIETSQVPALPQYQAPTQLSRYDNTRSQSTSVSSPAPRAYRGLPPSPTYIEPTNVNINASSSVRTIEANNANEFITVQPGDTVYAIARRTGHRPNDIIAINNMIAPYALAVGETLRLPGAVSRTISSGSSQSIYVNDPYRNDISRTISYDTPAQSVTAPAISRGISREVIARDVLYTVVPGDTLYSISRNNGISVQSVANANRLGAPYSLSVGQQLLLPAVPVNQARTVAKASPVYSSARPLNTQPVNTQPLQAYPQVNQAQSGQPRGKIIQAGGNTEKNIASITREASFNKTNPVNPANQFSWPVKGSVISSFGTGNVGRRNEGINISAPQGTTIRSAAPGEVVYRGSELDGYGNLMLIKHDGGYVTAYAHVDVMLVRKGQKVKKGQIIGKVGKTGAVNEPQLHFEIRKNTTSVDPLRLLASN